MSATETLRHRERLPAGGAAPEGALVLLHGRGADENDLYPLLDLLDPDRRLVGATVRAPLALPPGGAHWYVVRQVGRPDRETFDAVYALLGDWLDQFLADRGLAPNQLVLGGFSQGTAMSYALALDERREPPGALIALSGFIPEVEDFPLSLAQAKGLPVAVGHGSHDPVISVEFARSARARLEEAEAKLSYREAPIGHQIDPRFLASLPAWLRANASL